MGSPIVRKQQRRLSPSVEGEGSSGYSWFLSASKLYLESSGGSSG